MIKKLKEYLKTHETVLQFVKFTLFSMIAGISETVVFLVLNWALPASGVNAPVKWFVFDYPTAAGGQGAMIAFIVSAFVGMGLSFIINFKKTFYSTNNIVVSAVGYAIMSVLIIVGLNTYVGGLLNEALCRVIPNTDVAGFIAKMICQFSSFLIVFPMNKFVIMRKKKPEKEAETTEAAETGEESAAEV
jgi:putative flippase GtrA